MQLVNQTDLEGSVGGSSRHHGSPPQWTSEEVERLRTLIPLNTLDERLFNVVLTHAVVDASSPGTKLCYDEAPPELNYYLIEGALEHEHKPSERLEADHESATAPLGTGTYVAAEPCRVLCVDYSVVSAVAVWEFSRDQVDESTPSEWIPRVIESDLFSTIPAASIPMRRVPRATRGTPASLPRCSSGSRVKKPRAGCMLLCCPALPSAVSLRALER